MHATLLPVDTVKRSLYILIFVANKGTPEDALLESGFASPKLLNIVQNIAFSTVFALGKKYISPAAFDYILRIKDDPHHPWVDI